MAEPQNDQEQLPTPEAESHEESAAEEPAVAGDETAEDETAGGSSRRAEVGAAQLIINTPDRSQCGSGPERLGPPHLHSDEDEFGDRNGRSPPQKSTQPAVTQRRSRRVSQSSPKSESRNRCPPRSRYLASRWSPH